MSDDFNGIIRDATVTKCIFHVISINFVELESPMIHAKFQDHLLSGSGGEFLRFLPHMGMVDILVM